MELVKPPLNNFKTKHYHFFLKKNRRKNNPIARVLNIFTPKTIPNKKKYNRKKFINLKDNEWI